MIVETPIEEAVAVLNRHRHRGSDDWVALVIPGELSIAYRGVAGEWFGPFEATAIARMYEPDFHVTGTSEAGG